MIGGSSSYVTRYIEIIECSVRKRGICYSGGSLYDIASIVNNECPVTSSLRYYSYSDSSELWLGWNKSLFVCCSLVYCCSERVGVSIGETCMETLVNIIRTSYWGKANERRRWRSERVCDWFNDFFEGHGVNVEPSISCISSNSCSY